MIREYLKLEKLQKPKPETPLKYLRVHSRVPPENKKASE